MRLVLGGVAQGKRNYVKTAYHRSENDIFSGENAELEQLCGAKAVDKFHLWVRRKVKEQADGNRNSAESNAVTHPSAERAAAFLFF